MKPILISFNACKQSHELKSSDCGAVNVNLSNWWLIKMALRVVERVYELIRRNYVSNSDFGIKNS